MALRLSSQRHVACPYCFVDIDLRKVAFRCAGVPMAGRQECVPHVDPQRVAVLRDHSTVLPPVLAHASDGHHIVDDRGEPELLLAKFDGRVPCDRCQGMTSIKICPHCHSLLPEELREGAVSIGVVGARNSGKTVLLALFEKQMLTGLTQRFQVAVDHPGGTIGLANDLNVFRDDMERDGRLPAQTQAVGGGRKAPSVYRWKWVNGPARIISVYDTAGEDVANRDNAMAQHHLRAANAIFLVIDPLALAENRHLARNKGIDLVPETLQNDILDGLTSVLRQQQEGQGRFSRSGKISTPLAVVVTKMDALWETLDPNSPLRTLGEPTPYFDEQDSQTIHDHLMMMLNQWGGGSLVNKIQAEFDRYRFFAVSSLGGEPEYRTGRLPQNQVMPSRVLDPLLWVLAGQGFVQSQGPQVKG